MGCESHRYTTENDGGSADRPVNAVSTVSPSPNVTAIRAASVVAASSTAGGSRNSHPGGAADVQTVHREFEDAGRQVGVQPDPEAADHRDQRVLDGGHVGQRTFGQRVDRGGGMLAQIAAGLPTALDDLRGPAIHAVSRINA